jgi:hypothetical protein
VAVCHQDAVGNALAAEKGSEKLTKARIHYLDNLVVCAHAFTNRLENQSDFAFRNISSLSKAGNLMFQIKP